ncbi:Kelch repeat-containing protein [[Eubacterium] cellulosolvens]
MENNKIIKILWILIILFSLCISNFLLIDHIPFNPTTASAASTWTQTSDNDFNSGTLNGVTLSGTGDNTELILDLFPKNKWTDKNPSTKPSARNGHDMVTIFGTDKILLFGGSDEGNNRLNDTWIYNITTNKWDQIITSEIPTKRELHAMAPIYQTDKVLLFSGLTCSDTCVYDLSDNSWTWKNPAVSPNSRSKHAMAMIWGTRKVLLFGGTTSGASDETWVYDLDRNEWSRRHPTGQKPSDYSFGHKMATIYGTDKILMFGGYVATDFVNSTWVYDYSENRWTNMKPNNYPKGRTFSTMATLFDTDKVVLFGGYSDGWDQETWIYDLSENTWTRKFPSTNPNGRSNHAMAMSYHTRSVIMFGGSDDTKYYDDTWIYDAYSYSEQGSYISKTYDTGSETSFKTINWNGELNQYTDIKIQLRTAETEAGLETKDFIGPDGKTYSYYTTPGTDIWSGHYGARWVQFKMLLSTTNEYVTPSFKDMTIDYNCLPKAILIGPENGSKETTNDRTFHWRFSDLDSSTQTAFQVIISDNISFNEIIYDSGEQESSEKIWEFPSGTVYTHIPNGIWYWKVRVKDKDGDWGLYSEPWVVMIDTPPPESIIKYPVNNEYYSKLNIISGIAINPNFDSKLTNVEIIIQRLSDNYYWDGSRWIPGEIWLSVTGTSAWSYDSSLIEFDTSGQYLIRSRASDNKFNIEVPGEGITFYIDLEEPTSLFKNLKNNGWLNELDNISGSAMDIGGSEVDGVEIRIKQINDNKYWYGSDWITTENWLKTIGSNQWAYDAKNVQWSNGNQYIISPRAIDKAGNIEDPKAEFSFMFDDLAPENSSIIINDDFNYTKSTSIMLTLASEDILSGIDDMSFSLNGKTWSTWEAFNNTRSFELFGPDGEKKIYFKVRDHANNSAVTHDSIILDTAPPHSLKMSINDDATETESKSVTIEINATDDTSGVHQMSFSEDKRTWTPWENFSRVKIFDLSSEPGLKTVYFRVKDRAGNIASPIGVTITLKSSDSQNFLSISNLFWPLIITVIIIIILLVLLIIIRRKRRMKNKFSDSKPVTVKPGTHKRPLIVQNQSTSYYTSSQMQPITNYNISQPSMPSYATPNLQNQSQIPQEYYKYQMQQPNQYQTLPPQPPQTYDPNSMINKPKTDYEEQEYY